MILHRVLTVTRKALQAVAARIDQALAEPAKTPPEEPLTEAQQQALAEGARRIEREGRRRGTRPWYHSRPTEQRIPESLKYYEDIHGTEATLKMLAARSRKDR